MSRVILGAVVIGLCLTFAGLEWLGLWPGWLSLDAGKGTGFRP